MKLENEFVVPVPRAQAWDVLMDVERIAPCMPGATFDGYEGESFNGRVKVKLGPISVTYRGTATFVERDAGAGRAVIEASGKETRGAGTASATIVTVLVDQGDQTLVTVATDLAITGKPAQFGRGVMVEVGTKILGQFADCLAGQLGSGGPQPDVGATQPADPAGVADSGADSGAGTVAGTVAGDQRVLDISDGAPRAAATPREPARPLQGTDSIDLLHAAGPSVAKRIVPVLVAVVCVFALFRIIRRLLR